MQNKVVSCIGNNIIWMEGVQTWSPEDINYVFHCDETFPAVQHSLLALTDTFLLITQKEQPVRSPSEPAHLSVLLKAVDANQKVLS